jgi:hypothetical protein
MRMFSIFMVFHLSASDTIRDGATRAGMHRLGHKERHNPRSGAALDASVCTHLDFLVLDLRIFSCINLAC